MRRSSGTVREGWRNDAQTRRHRVARIRSAPILARPSRQHSPCGAAFYSTERQARELEVAIARRRRFYVLPWQIAWMGRLMKLTPRSLYDRALANRPHKPRSYRSDAE